MHTLTVKSVSGVQIRLTDERWRHITIRHPELALDKNRVIEAVKDPDFVAKGLHGELKAVRLFTDFPLGARYLIVIYRETDPKDGFIITARISSEVGNIIKGGVVWRRK
jgi:hypothetical protein